MLSDLSPNIVHEPLDGFHQALIVPSPTLHPTESPNDIEEIRVGFHDPYDPNKQIEDIRVVKVSDVANLIKMRNGG